MTTEPLLDHDFHSAWGSSYSLKGFSADQSARQLWEQYCRDPGSVDRQYHSILGEYTEKFHEFFKGYWPLSLHAHASDVLVPTTLATLILNAATTCPLVTESPELSPLLKEDPEPEKIQTFVRNLLGWEDVHVRSPRFVVAKGIYGAAYGPLAYDSAEWEYHIIAAGQKSTQIEVDGLSSSPLLQRLQEAKRQGCIAVILDLVRTGDGSIVSPEDFRILRECCHQAGLFLVVDEALTAIRCGAPWACQRPEYTQGDLEPDMVIFGKGMCMAGIAANFNGMMMRRMGFTKDDQILQSIRFCRAMVSRPVALPVLLEALGILNLAKTEDWPHRSRQIGEAVRVFVQKYSPGAEVRGLGALIAIDRDVSKQFLVMAAIRRRSPWVRWLPKLDSAAVSQKALESSIKGQQSKQNRSRLAVEAEQKDVLPLWCFVCGIDAVAKDWCRTCFLGSCGFKDCVDAFQEHQCIAA